MTQVNLSNQHPMMYERMREFDKTAREVLADASVDAILTELVKIRVSQLNGCAFCLRMHSRDAIAHGETPDRLAVLAAWWESQYFTEAERAALALAEEVTDDCFPCLQAYWCFLVLQVESRLDRDHLPQAEDCARGGCIGPAEGA